MDATTNGTPHEGRAYSRRSFTSPFGAMIRHNGCNMEAIAYHDAIMAVPDRLVVRGVFAHAWHLDASGQVLSVVTVPYDGPMAIRVRRPSLRGLEVRPDMPARLSGSILAVASLTIDLRRAISWTPLRNGAPLVPDALRRDLDRIEDILHPDGESPWRRRGRALAAALTSKEDDAAERRVRDLVGLGPGLTPAGDDILCGLLAGLAVLCPRAGIEGVGPQLASRVRAAVMRVAPGRTTALSRTLLAWAGRGVAAQPLLDVLWTLGSNREIEGLDALLRIGESSGREMLAGAALAASVVLTGEGIGGATLAGPSKHVPRFGQAAAGL